VTLPQPRVLVVDDEPQIRRALRVTLRANGYEVVEAADGETGLDLAATLPPDVVVLDLALPDVDGVEVCRRLREWSEVPVIVLSAVGDDDAKVSALDQGADDYVTKPFSTPELLARVRVAVRRGARTVGGDPIVRAGNVEIDLARRLVKRDGVEVHLTPTEYGILRFLAQHPDRVVTHGHLLRAVLGVGYEDAGSSLRVFVSTLRKKLEADPSEPKIIVTEPGVGYRLRSSV
jgi:two-component system KDP operon response regulator KdpE